MIQALMSNKVYGPKILFFSRFSFFFRFFPEKAEKRGKKSLFSPRPPPAEGSHFLFGRLSARPGLDLKSASQSSSYSFAQSHLSAN